MTRRAMRKPGETCPPQGPESVWQTSGIRMALQPQRGGNPARLQGPGQAAGAGRGMTGAVKAVPLEGGRG